MMRSRVAGAFAILGIVACNGIAGLGDLTYVETSAGAAPGVGGGSAGGEPETGGGGTGGSGGDGICVPDECPGTSTQCFTIECINNMCASINTPTLAPCTENGGSYCDGAGDCVECINDVDTPCPGGGVCQSFSCYTAGCNDSVLNNGESDTDCGGPNCGPCPLGSDCLVNADCQSLYCDNTECTACGTDQNCPTDYFCENATDCVPKGGVGESCLGDDSQCLSGCCVGSICGPAGFCS